MAAPGKSRPGRWLGLVVIVLVGLYLGLFLGPAQTPALGLDLRGGTEVTLTAHPFARSVNGKCVTGGKVTKSQLDQAENIIRQRANGLGVGGAEISTQGNTNIIVAVPGKGRDQVVNAVGETALLRFRQAVAQGPGIPTPTVTPSPGATTSSSASPAATATSSAAAKHPKSTKSKKSNSGRALSSALLAGKASPTPTATAPTATTTASATAPSAAPATSGSSASPSPASTFSPAPASTDASNPCAPTKESAANAAATVEAPTITPALLTSYNNLNCTNPKTNNPTQGNDNPKDYILACGTAADNFSKYILAPASVEGTQVTSANAGLDPNNQTRWVVNLSFNGSGSKAWQAVTEKAYNVNQGQPSSTCGPPTGCNAVAIVLDGVVQSAPYIETAGGIGGGSATISGNFNQKSANQLSQVLKYGSLPLRFDPADVNSVSPTLGSAQLRGGLIAGAIGLGLVIVFSLLYYRALGLVTVGSLAVSGLILYAVTTLLGHSSLGYTLSLPGIAGFIVAVGITADSFVVFFERLRDEIREGRRLRSAVDRAWPRARRTIISADFISILAAVILYIFSIGDVRGFAFTLGLSTFSDLFIVFCFTKPLLTLLSRRKAFDSGKAWTGIGRARSGTERDAEPPAGGRPTRRPSRPKEA